MNKQRQAFDRRDFFRGSAAACMAGFIPGLSELEPLRLDANTKKRLIGKRNFLRYLLAIICSRGNKQIIQVKTFDIIEM